MVGDFLIEIGDFLINFLIKVLVIIHRKFGDESINLVMNKI
jgi:hypothetical protein